MIGNEKELESPAWHGEILNEREAALNAGKVTVSGWEEAKERITSVTQSMAAQRKSCH